MILVSRCTKLLQTGWNDYYEIWCAYWLGLKIGEHQFYIPLNDKGDPIPNFFYFYGDVRLPVQLVLYKIKPTFLN